jgi:type IX secretion system PorP/SprF family membrane protein
MNKIIINITVTLALVFAMSHMAISQERYFDERYLYTQHFINPVLVNVGATGFHGQHQFLVNYRNKWANFPGSPTTVTLAYDGMVADRLGMGLTFMQDTYGALRTSKGQLGFAYHIESDVNKLGMGISAEYLSHGLTSNFGSSEIVDPTILQRLDGTQFLDLSFGIFGKYDNRITYGLAFPSLVSSKLENDTRTQDRELGFIFNMGYILQSSSTGITMEPSMFVKKLHQVPTHVDLNLRLGFLDDQFTGGISYTLGGDKRLGFLLGVGVENIHLFYSYNVSSQNFQVHNNGSHELTLRLRLGEMAQKQ